MLSTGPRLSSAPNYTPQKRRPNTPTTSDEHSFIYGLHYLDFATLLIYLLGITVIGLIASRGVKKSIDYFMGGRRFGKAVLIMHAFGTGTHTDQAVNVVGASYKLGLAGIWYAWLPLFVTPFYWLIMPLFR